MYLRQKNGRWYFTTTILTMDGTPKRVERIGGNTKTEAKKACIDFIKKTDRFGRMQLKEKITVKQFSVLWMNDYVENNLKQNTIDSYNMMLQKHILPVLGSKQLYKVTSIELQRFLYDKKNAGYSKATVSHMAVLLREIFKAAVHPYDYLDKSPAMYLRIPKYDEISPEKYIFSESDIEKIFDRFPIGHQFYIPIRIAYYTGMRLGEILALTKDKINIENQEIYISSTLYDKKGTPIIGNTPKSKTSVRTIVFGEALVACLKKHYAWQAKNKLQYGKYYIKNDFVCTREDGKNMTSNDMRYFNMYCKENFGSGASFHSLRHTHATRLRENGCELEFVSKRLGHASVEITSAIYSHITQKENAALLSILDNTFKTERKSGNM